MKPSTDYFNPLFTDVLVVKSLLAAKQLPLELVETILDFAEYWPRTAVQMEKPVHTNGNAAILCCTSLPIPGFFQPLPGYRFLWPKKQTHQECGEDDVEENEGGKEEGVLIGPLETRGKHPVRKIAFLIESADQGWSSDPSNQGTYRGSYTWSEAIIERPLTTYAVLEATTAGCLNDPVIPVKPCFFLRGEDHQGVVPARGLFPQDAMYPWRSLEIPTDRKISTEYGRTMEKVAEKWPIQRNRHAGRVLQKYEVVWSWDGVDPRAQEEWRLWEGTDEDGKGSGAAVVRALEAGDRIRVFARSKYDGWRNYTHTVKMYIYYAV